MYGSARDAKFCNIKWAMKVNADKCGVMHLRRNGVKRTTSLFSVGGERVKVVKSYKYLGCIVNEHMDCIGKW